MHTLVVVEVVLKMVQLVTKVQVEQVVVDQVEKMQVVDHLYQFHREHLEQLTLEVAVVDQDQVLLELAVQV